jgi:hypothetical protein
MNRLPLALLATAGFVTTVHAQYPNFTNDSSVEFNLTWREATSSGGTVSNPNSILDPGEYALLSLTVSFTNQGGTASIAPPIGTFTSGTIVGLGSGFLDINGSGGTAGAFNISNPLANSSGTSGFGVRSSWRLVDNGTINPAGDGVLNVEFGQFAAQPSTASTENPVTNVYRMLWQPSSYTARNVQFTPAGALRAGNLISSVYLDLNGTLGASAFVNQANISYHGVTIPIPAPATGAIALFGLTVAARRRRA